MGMRKVLWPALTAAVLVAASAQGQPVPPPAAAAANEPDSSALHVQVWSGSGQRDGEAVQILPDAASAGNSGPSLRDLPYGTLQLLDAFTIGEAETSTDRPLPDGLQFQFRRSPERDGPLTALIRVQTPSPEEDGTMLDAIRSTVRLDPGQGVLLRGIPHGSDELIVLVSRPSAGSDQPQSGEEQRQNRQQQEQQQEEKQQQEQQQQEQQQDSESEAKESSGQQQDQQPPEQQNRNQNDSTSDTMDPEQASETQPEQQDDSGRPENEASMGNIRGLLNALEEADQLERKEQLRQLRNRVEIPGDWW